ncbi:hypothetical protein [Thalassotalea atypica]|uniref:hypothetical protein n=1 Tax=Thalassotalea atypica TaxID=2054316 RepID=UPI002573CCCE|nr:hypothetical protein [Thalassotalea atypica]
MNLNTYNKPNLELPEQSQYRLLCIVAITLIFVLSFKASASKLKPFTTDGCSSFPDGTLNQRDLFLPCCIRHDLAYWQGGSVAQRLQVDQAFSACIVSVGKPKLAKLMFLGVRVGGAPYLPTPFRWGYGWPYPKGYGKLTEAEMVQVNELTPEEFK